MKINKLDSPIFIFLLCIFSLFVNTISAIHFFPIMLLGVLFMAFYVSLKRRDGYSLLFVSFTILLIELNNGFIPFSLILLSFFMYAFIIPYLKRVLSLDSIKSYVYIAVFYLGVFILWTLNNEITAQLNYTLLINLVIDFILFGVLI